MTRRARLIWGLVGLLVLLKVTDLVVGATYVPKSDDRVVRSKRTVVARLHEPNISVIVRPGDEYMEGVDGMQARDFAFRTDSHGFLMGGPEQSSGPVDITFMGGSATVCMYVDEAMRFPARVSQLLRRADGSPTRTQNGGLNINHTVHSTLNVVTTVLPQRPRIVAIMHNDFFLLAAQASYWGGPAMQAFHKEAAQESPWDKRTVLKRIRDFTYPNLWMFAREYVPDGIGKALNFHPGDEFQAMRSRPVALEPLKAEFHSSLTGLVRYLKAWNIEPVLMTQFNRIDLDQDFVRQQYEKRPLAMSWPEYVAAFKAFNDIVREIARENALLLIDLDRKVPRSPKYLYNAEHVNDAGSELVARIIAAEIAGTFKEYRAHIPAEGALQTRSFPDQTNEVSSFDNLKAGGKVE